MSTSDEPLLVRRRADLVVTQTGTPDHPIWTIKDPLSLQYFHLRSIDYFVWQHLDGAASAVEIAQRFFTTHAPEKLTPQQVLLFVNSLWNQGLVIVDQLGTASGLLERQRRSQKNAWLQQLTSVLSIRFRGIDPNWFLERLLPLVSWLFSRLSVTVSLALMGYAVVLVATEWDVILRELPRFDAFLSVDRILILGTAIASIKILHELGHAFACKRFGGEVREIGVMLLALMPCLYCNVSDAWLLKSRWRRIAISGAGIYTELVIASLATIIWAWSVPGVVHSVSLYVMIVCSVNTLFLNGNPLLRYDGYYVLSDLVNVPNLRRRSTDALSRLGQRLFFRRMPIRQSQSPWWQQTGLIIYGACAAVYVWLVLFGILWMLYRFAKPYGIESVVIVVGGFLVIVRVGTAGLQFLNFLRTLHERGQMRILTTLFTLLSFSGIAWWGLTFPLPRYVTTPVVIRPVESTTLFVSSPGVIEFADELEFGQSVQRRDVLARLRNHEIVLQLTTLQGQLTQQKRRLELLEFQLAGNPQVAALIPTTQAQVRDLQARLDTLQTEAKRLELEAPADGILLQASAYLPPTGELSSREQPLRPRVQGAWLESGTALCEIASAESKQAVVYVEQTDLAHLSLGTEVGVTTLQTGGQVLRGTITEISAKPVDHLPPVLVISNRVAFRPGPDGKYSPLAPMHEVTVVLGDHPKLLPFQTGTASISLSDESAWDKFARSMRRTFTFDL